MSHNASIKAFERAESITVSDAPNFLHSGVDT